MPTEPERLTLRPGRDYLLSQAAFHQERLGRPVLFASGFAPLEPGGPGELASYDSTNDAGEPQPHGYFGFDVHAADVPIFHSLDLAPSRVPNHRLSAHITRHTNGMPDIDLMAQRPKLVGGEFMSGRKIVRGTTYIVDSEGWVPADSDGKGFELGLPMQYWHAVGEVAILGSSEVTTEDLVGTMRTVADPWTEYAPDPQSAQLAIVLPGKPLIFNVKTTIT